METQWEPLPGGWSGESFLADVAGEASVVRICSSGGPRGAAVAHVDASLMRLVRGLVPVPEVLEVRPSVEGGPALLVTRHVPGPRGDDVVRGAAAEVLTDVGRQMGRIAGTLAGVATLEPGDFVDGQLRTAPRDGTDGDLAAWVAAQAADLRGLDADGRDRLMDLAGRAQDVLDAVGRSSVVHGDLHPKNVVLDPETLRVRAVVDWEHAHSGSPYCDLGSLLRFDRDPVWEAAVLAGWEQVRDEDPGQALHRARCADLRALVDLASRPGGNLVVDLAECFLGEIVRTGDVHACP